MSPVSMVEETRELDAVSERDLAERRFSALAAACASTRRRFAGELLMRPEDAALYRRLRRICGGLGGLTASAP